MKFIPAIDIIDGKCVRLTKGDYNQKKEYSGSPLDIAKGYEDAGCERLHLVDLDGAKQKHVINHKVLEQIASNTNLTIDFGGGIQSDKDLSIAFESGAAQITGGSVAVKNEPLFSSWIEKFGAEKIILGADARDGKIAVSGWQETSELDIIDFIAKYKAMGLHYVISTDVNKDGLLQGPSFELYNEISDKIEGLSLIASGGVSGMEDIYRLKDTAIYGVIVGKAIYEGKISLKDIEEYHAN
jgi:phosphoribosylformimino-5-aminoimidazole carboxamide ribotide isomerase